MMNPTISQLAVLSPAELANAGAAKREHDELQQAMEVLGQACAELAQEVVAELGRQAQARYLAWCDRQSVVPDHPLSRRQYTRWQARAMSMGTN